jgi:hypothetical protein
MSDSNILAEAMKDVDLLKEAAVENAKNVLVEAISPNIKEFVDGHLGEGEDMPAYEDEEEKEMDLDDTQEETFAFEVKDEEEDEDLEEAKDSDEEDEDLDEVVEITSEDLQAALSEMMAEANVTSGFGDAENPNSNATGGLGEKSAPGERGLEDKEKEEMWKDAEAPASEDWTVKEAKYRKYIKRLQAENKRLNTENKKVMTVANALRRNVQEVNLFNSKLLHTNKLLQSTQLEGKARTKIIEAFDAASSIREVELVYKSLSESLKITGVLGEGRNKRSWNQRSSGRTASGSTSKMLKEQAGDSQEDSFSKRMQELSGLID